MVHTVVSLQPQGGRSNNGVDAGGGVAQVCGADRTDPILPKQRPDRIRTTFATITSITVVLGAMLVSDATQAGASSPADQGVTSSTIRIGISVINFTALQAVGVTLNDGNYQDAVSALTANMNAHGGVDGRKVVPYFVEMNPANAASIDSSCSELTEDDKVFIVLFPVYPDCLSADLRHARHRGSVTGTRCRRALLLTSVSCRPTPPMTPCSWPRSTNGGRSRARR